jgi:hypothetical protein
MTMKHAVLGACLALSIAMGPSAVWAQDQQQQQDDQSGTALDFWIAGWDTSDSRKDVDEVSQPPPPSGPASIICGPSDPFCP